MIQHSLKTVLAFTVATSLLFTFVGCVLSCEELCKERATKRVTVSSAELQHAQTNEECPLNSFPKAVTSQRLYIDSDCHVQLVQNSISSDYGVRIPTLSFFAPDVLRSALGPPFKRLRSLRI
jgi:hypothetical protein